MTSPETTAASPDVVAPGGDGFLSLVRESLRGARHDFTSLPLGRAILLLAVPMVLEMVMESVFAVVDVFWVAHLGPNAVATVGLTESMLTLVYTAAMGLSIGATAILYFSLSDRLWNVKAGENAPAAAKWVAAIVLLAWAGVIVFGRLLPYL